MTMKSFFDRAVRRAVPEKARVPSGNRTMHSSDGGLQ